MSENREPRISHLTKPRTRTLISSYRPFLESLTRSALTAYYRAHVVNWPSFFNNQLGWFPRLALCSLPPRSGWLSRKKEKKLPFSSLFPRQSSHQLIHTKRQSKPKVPIFTQKPSFFSFFSLFSASFLAAHYTPRCAVYCFLISRTDESPLVRSCFYFSLYQNTEARSQKWETEKKNIQKHKTVSADRINPTRRDHLFNWILKNLLPFGEKPDWESHLSFRPALALHCQWCEKILQWPFLAFCVVYSRSVKGWLAEIHTFLLLVEMPESSDELVLLLTGFFVFLFECFL